MIHADQRFNDAVEKAVAELEKGTDAEVVVVAAERSGSYRDVAMAVGSLTALITFVLMVVLPYPIHPILIVVDLIVVWALVTWAVEGQSWLVRLVSADRRQRQVADAAAVEFHREAVHATPRRTGLLVYVSAWEGQVELIPDVGLEARIPRGRWAEAAGEFAHDDLDHFVRGLGKVGELLAETLPRTQGQRVDLDNAPRIRA